MAGKQQSMTIAQLLALVGHVECSECRSWYRNTKHGSLFHARRCTG